MTHPGKEALSRIIEAMNGVSAGRWCQFHPSYCQEAAGTSFSDWDTSHDVSAVNEGVRKRIATFKHADDAAFVDAASQDAIRSIAEYIESLTRERDEAREALKPWQPIATAPRDETEILVDDSRVAGFSMMVVFYAGDNRNLWVWHTYDGISYHEDAFTHWMPLPAFPALSKEPTP